MRALLAIFAIGLAACGGSSGGGDGGTVNGNDGSVTGGGDQPSSLVLFSPAITAVTIEVDYQTGAVPYTGSAGLALGDVWDVTSNNIGRLFQNSPKTLVVPHTLADMQELTDVTGGTFTSDQILAIAKSHRDQKNSGATATFYVVFLDGYLQDDGGTEKNVIGVSLGDSGVLAMFKPVIESTGSGGLDAVPKYVEQSTLVHELGHAVGLVNNGLPLTSQHQDTAHGAHCTNTKCTMFWENEGASSAVDFAKQAFTTGSTVIYGAECLADVDAVAH